MMEEITIEDKYIIVIINNIKGNIQRLNIILEKLKTNIDIDYLFLIGEVFDLQTKEEDFFKIQFNGSIIIFDISPFGETIKAKLPKNIIFLGKSGIFTPPDSVMNVAYLSGNEMKEYLEKNNNKINSQHSNKYYEYKDIENIINNFIELKINNKNNKIDFFLINNFPHCFYNRYINIIKENSINNNSSLNEELINNSISYSLNYLLYIMNPRYIITSVDDFFYKNTKDTIVNGDGYRTFFYNLAYMEGKKNVKENFYIALDYKSLNNMNNKEISLMEKKYEERIGQKFFEDKNIFKYFNNFGIDNNKSLIQNFDEYLKLCFNENKIKSLKENLQENKPLFISNINFNCTEEELKNYLVSRYGPIKQLKILTNKDNKFNGKAIVQFADANSMKDMLNNSSKEKFNDRIIKTLIYVPRDQLNNNNTINNSNNNNNNNNNNNKINNNINNASDNNNLNLNLNYSSSQTSNKEINNNTYINNIKINKNNEDCWFCYDKKDDLDKQYILEEFNYFFLSLSKGPINKYHFLIIPKRHISFYINLTDDEKIESEMIIKLLQQFLNLNGCEFIIFEKNLKYNFSRNIHLLINVVGFKNNLISKINEFTENFLFEEKINQYMAIYNDNNLYLYTYEENNEYININIPQRFKDKIIRKIFLIKTKEYKIDYPRKLICLLLNKEERINWKDTMNSGEEFLNEIKTDIKKFFENMFLNK